MMTDALEARAIEAARLAIDDVHDMDVSLDRYAEAAAKAVLWEVKTGSGDGHVAYLMARADAWIARGLYQGAKPLVPALRDALAAALTRQAETENALTAAASERDRLRMHAEALEAEMASGSFFKESEIDAMQDSVRETEKENARLRIALEQIAETPARRFQRKIARAALTGEPQR